MKTRNLILIASIFILSSCIVKSLHPFYTSETISFDKNFLGEWEDDDGVMWSVKSIREEILEDKKASELSRNDLKEYKKYQYAYLIQRKKKETKTVFLAMPFKIKNQFFLDFIPFDFDLTSTLMGNHLIATHSLAKYDVLKNGKISIKWFDEDKISDLFKNNKIKIKHEKIGLMNDKYLLTAKSDELQAFLKKYIASKDEEKWKTSTKFTLTKVNGKTK